MLSAMVTVTLFPEAPAVTLEPTKLKDVTAEVMVEPSSLTIMSFPADDEIVVSFSSRYFPT